MQRSTRGLFVLQGGGDDVDHNYVRMGQMGGGGDFVVLRATGDDEYNDYIYKLCTAIRSRRWSWTVARRRPIHSS